MSLPILGALSSVAQLLPIFRRKGVQAGVLTALTGGAGQVALGQGVLTDPQLVALIDALTQLMIAAGTVVAAWKGRKISKRARARAPRGPSA